MRYAQEYGGQKLHLVYDRGDFGIDSVALCGRNNYKRGAWRMTINAPLGHACKNCLKVYDSKNNQ